MSKPRERSNGSATESKMVRALAVGPSRARMPACHALRWRCGFPAAKVTTAGSGRCHNSSSASCESSEPDIPAITRGSRRSRLPRGPARRSAARRHVRLALRRTARGRWFLLRSQPRTSEEAGLDQQLLPSTAAAADIALRRASCADTAWPCAVAIAATRPPATASRAESRSGPTARERSPDLRSERVAPVPPAASAKLHRDRQQRLFEHLAGAVPESDGAHDGHRTIRSPDLSFAQPPRVVTSPVSPARHCRPEPLRPHASAPPGARLRRVPPRRDRA